MTDAPLNPDLPISPPPDPVDDAWAPLLAEPFASAWARPLGGGSGPPSALQDGPGPQVRQRLAQRLAASRRAEAAFTTVRRRHVPRLALAAGVSMQLLYAAARPQALRPGEPLRALLIQLAPGARLPAAAAAQAGADDAAAGLDPPGLQREWLLLSGSARLDGQPLSQRDYHWRPPGSPAAHWHSAGGALLFLRESAPSAGPAPAGTAPFTVRDAEAGWPAFVPGIQRRVLWQQGGEAALLYYAQPGAQVPAHQHGHDEECLMLQGELFLDDVLLQAGDYQLAPAGTGHRITATDTGVVIYAHGDLDLRLGAA